MSYSNMQFINEYVIDEQNGPRKTAEIDDAAAEAMEVRVGDARIRMETEESRGR